MMKNYLWMLLVAWASIACGACSTSTSKAGNEHTAQDAQPAGPQMMQASNITETFAFKGKEYRSTIVRQPDESLPLAVNEQGEEFVDNRISMQIVCGEQQVFSRVFTKEIFAPWVDAQFLSHAILEGLVFNTTNSEGMVFTASLGYPHTDMYVPMRIVVAADGSCSIRKEDLMEDVQETDTPQ